MLIKAGKWYRRRDGDVIGPALLNAPGDYPWLVGDRAYTDHGFFNASGAESRFDLVAEVERVGPPTPRPSDVVVTNTPRVGETAAEAAARMRHPEHPAYLNRPADGIEKTGIAMPADGVTRTYDLDGELCGSIEIGSLKTGRKRVPNFDPDDGYEPLAAVLNEALQQAASGKGRERHSQNKPFNRQPILEIGRMLRSADGELFQAIKKAQEASGMASRGEPDRAVAELLGAINYLAAAVILIREKAA